MPRATSQPSRTRSPKRKAETATRRHRLQDRAIGALIWLMLRLPYRQRVAATGWIVTHLVAPLAGWRPRIRANLAHVFPDLPDPEVRRLSREVPRNFGRALIELFSPEGLRARACAAPINGPGLAAIEQAQAAGRPVIIATAHMGNYDAARAALIARGFPLGALYMPMTNPDFNRRYVAAMEAIGTPLFPRGREGLAGMLRHLRDGGMLALVTDHYIGHGEPLDFMGKPALTALSTAELALKYDALLVPGYCIRQPDGVNFRIEAEAPIEHGDPRTMTQALNDSVAAQVRAHMDQWLWMHRRWKKAKGAPV